MQWLAQPVSGQGNSFRSRLRKLPAISESFVRREFESQQFLQKWRCSKLSDQSPIHLWIQHHSAIFDEAFWRVFRSSVEVAIKCKSSESEEEKAEDRVGRQGAEMCADVNGLFKAQWLNALYWCDSGWLPQFFEGCLLQAINHNSRPSCRTFSKCQTVQQNPNGTTSNYMQHAQGRATFLEQCQSH